MNRWQYITYVHIFATFFVIAVGQVYKDFYNEPDFLDMDPDSILEENAIIEANATCGIGKREHFCHLVEHADGPLLYKRAGREKRQVMSYSKVPGSYRDPRGQWIQCNYCDDSDPRLRHPIEYVLRGEQNLWWQSPSLAEGMQYHAVTITMDFRQVYQIVYVLLRMGDSPRPANWILERSLDGVDYMPWVFFAETEYDCSRLYQPLLNQSLTVTSAPRPWKLEDDEVYCTTFYSQPQTLQSGEIIVTLPLDRSSTTTTGVPQAISPKLIEFLSARFVRLRFQKLQTLSGNWMAMPNQPDISIYNRYYYSIRTIKVGGKCVCNSHATRCEQRVVDDVPRAVCVCQHNTCGGNCEKCCPLFNQQQWQPGRLCEECSCNNKADACVFNQTVANLRLSMRKDGVYEGGGVCLDCRENTDGVNCEKCKPGHYRPLDVRPDAPNPCVPCRCDVYGSTGQCVTNDAELPERYPGDCICKTGFSGRLCDQCAQGYQRSSTDPSQCVPCTCDIQGSQPGGGYQCEPPCNCKVNVLPDSNCRTCLPGHFNLDIRNPEGCQACYCSGLTDQCSGVTYSTALTLERRGLLGPISTTIGWQIIVPNAPPESGYPLRLPNLINTLSTVNGVEAHSLPLNTETREVESWLTTSTGQAVDRGYYWLAPSDYLGNQITAYRSQLAIILRITSNTMTHYTASQQTDGAWREPGNNPSLAMMDHLNYMWLNEPDVVLEGNGFRLAHILSAKFRDSHIILNIPLHESAFRVLVEPPLTVPVDRVPIGMAQGTMGLHITQPDRYSDRIAQNLERAGRPATVADLMKVLANLERLMIKTKFIQDQTSAELRSVTLDRVTRDPQTGGIPNMEECQCPTGHTGTSCESCAPGFWRGSNGSTEFASSSQSDNMWTSDLLATSSSSVDTCVPCSCHGHSNQCDPRTGQCIDCQHNTAGHHCERCSPGYYGDPRSGDRTACRPCECPTLFKQMTKACIAHELDTTSDLKPYVCVDCEENTRGRYCEICAEGYYGDPINGVPCVRCDCGAGAVGCNSTTGACICGDNTGGPRCDICAEGTHGDPLTGQPCRPCNCHEKGSVSPSCRLEDGQCTCHSGYEGTRCERCAMGRGNVDGGCPLCNCDPIGSVPNAWPPCNQVTGQCQCKPGVGGTLDCSRCQPGYHHLGLNGCIECTCSKRAVDLICQATTGKCNCGENVLGDTCDRCSPGHYWNVTGPNCLPCDCGPGTIRLTPPAQTEECNMETGQCKCAPFVTGRRCTKCEPGFFGVTSEGCQPCPKCPNGQLCDQVTGKCICPPNTNGDKCDQCTPGAWGYNPVLGCKSCNCSTTGTPLSERNSCNLNDGQCICRPGYAGRACDSCAPGYYGYPQCQLCDCDVSGTQRQNDTVMQMVACNSTDGSCVCKQNVQGKRCDQCKPGTFGLSMDYALGCYSCFCFPTSQKPAKCDLLTGYRAVPGTEKGVEIISTDEQSSPGGPLIQVSIGLGNEAVKDLAIGVSQFKWRFSTHRPTYLEVPDLKGSFVRNYGSPIISVTTDCLPTVDCRLTEPPNPFSPTSTDLGVRSSTNSDMAGNLVVRRPYKIDAKMTAQNNQLELEYQPPSDGSTSLSEGIRHIWLREKDWVLTRVIEVDTRVRPTRNELMLALMNVTSFSVRLFMPEAKPNFVTVKYRVHEVLSDTATQSGTQIRSIEKCVCPTTASGDHCEVAAPGFYFPTVKPKPGPSLQPPKPGSQPPLLPENMVWSGGVEKCRCHGMTPHCDPVTGVCKGCTGHTTGLDCGQCAVGYMGDPKLGQPCIKCQCPTDKTDFAISCSPSTPDHQYGTYRCICKPGYSGLRCEACAPGYFGDPNSFTACQPCDCDPSGTMNRNCAQDTGQCTCWPGIRGRRCDQCEPDHVVDNGVCRDCRGPCTGELLIRADEVKDQIDNLNVTSLAHRGLARLGEQVERLTDRFNTVQEQKETSLIERTRRLAKQTSELRQTLERARSMQLAVGEMQCSSQRNMTSMRNEAHSYQDIMVNWIEEIRLLPPNRPDEQTMLRWREEARMAKLKLTDLKLNTTQEWVGKLTQQLNKVIKSTEEQSRISKPGRSTAELDRLSTYQDEQVLLINFFTDQVYRIGNATMQAANEVAIAKEVAKTSGTAVKEAVNATVIESFERNSSQLRELLVNLSAQVSGAVVEGQLEKARTALRQLNSLIFKMIGPDQQAKITQLEYRIVVPIEQTADTIVNILTPSAQLNRTIEAKNAYKEIVENSLAAEKAADEAEAALSSSSVEGGRDWQSLLEKVKADNQKLTGIVDQQHGKLVQYNDSLNEVNGVLETVASDMEKIEQTGRKSLSDANEVTSQVESIQQIMKDIQPQVDEVTIVKDQKRLRLQDLNERLTKAENLYTQIQGTAQSTVDQANTTQVNLERLISSAENTVKKLDTKLLRLRRLAEEARSQLDVNYGALAQDPIPLQLGRGCVYTLVPYALTKSRVFDIEFWFNLHSSAASVSSMSSVLMVGRRAFTGRTQMFAFTLEVPDPKIRFSWNVREGNLEIGPVKASTWYQVRVTAISGKTKMQLWERLSDGSLDMKLVGEEVSLAGANHPESALMLDRQMEIRVGGAIQPSARLVNPEAWGDNAAEAFWSRLLSLDSVPLCVFNLRLAGLPVSLVDLATATATCKKPQQVQCQLHQNNRPVFRDGYVWRRQGELSAGPTNISRPSKELELNSDLQRLFYYDFSGAGGYNRLQPLQDLKFCTQHVHFQLTPLTDVQLETSMVMTFFNYDKDTGVTLEMIDGRPRATRWSGGQLYRSQHSLELLGVREATRVRVLRAARSPNSRWRQFTNKPEEERRPEQISLRDPSLKLWRFDELLTKDCTDETILFVGSIPPGQYAMRRRMYELKLSLTPFRGRIGLTNGDPGQEGTFYLEDFENTPVSAFGDTHFTDLRQRGEALAVPSRNLQPDAQYCLQLTPHDVFTPLELKTRPQWSPWQPGISMTVRFNPLTPMMESVDLLRLQVSSAQWLRVWLTTDHRVGIIIPELSKEVLTQDPITFRPVEDQAFSLRHLELSELRMVNASLPVWKAKEVSKSSPTSGIPPSSDNGPAGGFYNADMIDTITSMGDTEVVLTLYFGGPDSKQMFVLYDQRVVQSWTIPRALPNGQVNQAFVGPYDSIRHAISINHLVIGEHIVDFSKELVNPNKQPGVRVGNCGGKLRPRFLKRSSRTGAVWIMQGLDLAPPPGGRRLRFVPIEASDQAGTIPDVSKPEFVLPSDGKLRRMEDCAENPTNTAWFGQMSTSYWQLNDFSSMIIDRSQSFDVTIGFRAQLSQGTPVLYQSTGNRQLRPTPSVYSILFAFTFGPNRGSLYVILSESQIFVVCDTRGVLWSSPHLTIADTNWHRLKVVFPPEQVNNGNGFGVESGVQINLDGRQMSLPNIDYTGPPTVIFVGGAPGKFTFQLDSASSKVTTSGLFGCVDELAINNKNIPPKTSGLPVCYDCFSLDPNLVHVPPTLETQLKSRLIQLVVPEEFLTSSFDPLSLDFSFFYNREVITKASLFVLTFTDYPTGTKFRVWLYLSDNEVKLSYIKNGEKHIDDLGQGVELVTIPRNQNTWQFIKLDIGFMQGSPVFFLRSQVAQSLPIVPYVNVNRLQSIHFSQDDVITPELMEMVFYSPGKPFSGCLRDIRLSRGSNVGTVRFPDDIDDLLDRVCHTSRVW